MSGQPARQRPTRGEWTMTNPFDTQESGFYPLRNAEGQFSLWPSSIEVPEGWHIAHGETDRRSCLTYIGLHWIGPAHTQITANEG